MTREELLTRYEELVRRIGTGFHPDTPAAEYEPPLPPDLSDYDEVVSAVFALGDVDPYLLGMQIVGFEGDDEPVIRCSCGRRDC